ncbi:membrane protein insertion efficiency factor YidD [bacterium Unc6]|nr:membrane protein insertion efficiency factor YidD [bacterium Unc6]
MNNVLIKFIRILIFIRRLVLPIGCCRFYPTCSEYIIQVFEKFCFCKALVLSVKRIIRCNPLCKGGYDPTGDRRQRTGDL